MVRRDGSLQTYKDNLLSIAWKGGLGRAKVANPQWGIDPEELEGVSLRWPSAYEWPDARLWVEPLLTGFKRFLRYKAAEIAQPYQGIVLFQLAHRDASYDIAIDYSDYADVNQECAGRCLVYFKMQHSRGGYPLPNVVPGGYVPDSRRLYLYLSRLRKVRDKKDFVFDVYGRFSLDFAKDRRRQAVEILRGQEDFRFEGGLTKVDYVQFLKDIARSKICIDLPGNGDFCHRLINYFAIGACVVGPRHGTILHAPLNDRQHIAYTKDDLSDLVELCNFYLENEQAREEMCRESRRFFDLYLHRDNLTAYYLRTLLDRLPDR